MHHALRLGLTQPRNKTQPQPYPLALGAFKRAVPVAVQHIHGQHLHGVALGVLHQLRGLIKPHGLAVEQCGQKTRGFVAFHPGAYVNQQRKTCRVALGKAVLAKALNLLKNLLSKGCVIPSGHHAADDACIKAMHPAAAAPRGHGAAQAVGLIGVKPRGQHGHLHHLLLKHGHTQGTAQGLLQARAGHVHRLQPLATTQIRVHHAALNRPGAHNGDFDHQVVKTTRAQARQHGHLRPAFNLKHAHAVGAAQHVVGGRVFGRNVLQRQRTAMALRHERQGAA